ncbi:uncharacterized protein LOC110706917 [Chenopodium quinoa]|uniref:Uncharacterized protein n=1 Tax=Chenopodium quinoa TaxID=63459 RepID=A0A803LPZ2_CHEQI|nr:uncharacterized protein LOC110706917 [Chenopodium quinoa]
MAITGAPGRFPAGRRVLAYDTSMGDEKLEYCDELAVSSSDSVFGFLEGSIESTTSNEGYHQEGDAIFDEEEEGENSGNIFEENKTFWENQHNLLQATLCRTTSLETGIRNVTKEALKELQDQGHYCKCGKAVAGNNCRSCMIREVSSRLRIAGYNSAICRTKWRSTPEIPAGEHTFIDVVDNSSSKRGEVRVIIELSFRADFEIARASDDYNRLVSRLPEVFVGKADRLKALIKVLCAAAKKCMKDKKMHMGPWRKQKYKQAKWFSTPYERKEEVNAPANRVNSSQISKPARAASMLTIALMDMHRKPVAVV